MNKKIVGLYSVIHFIVDLSCAILATNLITQKMGQNANLFIAILIYNFFAFAMQLPIGILADKVNRNAICSAIGCILVAIAFGFVNFGIISCIIAGIGNAMFHIGGGIDILNISDKKATLSGIFVSTGAMGIFLGGKSASIGFDKISISLLISAICFIFSFTNPIIGIIAILLFNMTMPITLICLSNIFYNNKGLAFGLLTLALFVGAVPTFVGYNQGFTKIGLFIITLISSIILYVALRYYNKSVKFKERRVENERY